MIEMLVVVMIIMLVSTIGINTYQNQRRQVQFNDSILKVSTLIKTARNYAITSRSTYDTCQPGKETYVPAEGYGIYINRSTSAGQARFVLFANRQAANDLEKNQYDETADPCFSDRIEEEFQLNNMAVLNDLLTSISPLAVTLDSNTHADENEVVILFKTTLAETTIAANDHPPTADLLTRPVDLYLQFQRPTASASAPSTYIHINRLAGFPEIDIQ